jgi:hypothetical protein
MERKLWRRVYRMVRSLSTSGVWGMTNGRRHHSDAAIALVFLWAALHDRPRNWACCQDNWTGWRRPKQLPSPAALSRRLRSCGVQTLLRRLGEELRAAGPTRLCKIADAKPLSVSPYSRDPDACWGRGAGRMAKGYKLYAIWDDAPFPCAWEVRPMNASEPVVAREMLPQVAGGGYLLGDAVYDVNPLYEAAADTGHQLLAPRKRPPGSLGHRTHSPHRLRAMALLSQSFGQTVFTLRTEIERQFGRLTNTAGGLGPLPNWVRRLHRVRIWVHAKLLLHAIRLTPD